MSAWVKVSVTDRATPLRYKRAVDWSHIDRVDQLAIGVVDVGGVQHGGGDHIADRPFGDRVAGVGRQYLFVVDGRDVDVDGAEVLIGSAACAGVAIVVDDDVDGVGIVAEGVGGPVQVLHVAGCVQEGVQTGQGAGQSQRSSAAAAHRHAATAGGTQVAAGRRAERDGQVAARVIDVTQVDGRQVDVAADIFGNGDVSRQRARVGRIVVDAADSDITSQRVAVHIAIVDREGDGPCQGGRVLAGVGISDRAQSRFVLGERGGSAQAQRARARCPGARDPVLIDEG